MTERFRKPRKWTTREFRIRMAALEKDGFIPEEAFLIANWDKNLDHRVIHHMRLDRRALMRSFKAEKIEEEEIASTLRQRYIDLGIKGLYEEEEWYFSRVGATAA